MPGDTQKRQFSRLENWKNKRIQPFFGADNAAKNTSLFSKSGDGAARLQANVKSRLLTTSILTTLSSGVLSSSAFAQTTFNAPLEILQFNSGSVIPLAIFGGAVTFSLLSAFWMIRERSKIVSQNQKLRDSHAEIKAEKNRIEALMNSSGQKIIIWQKENKKPILMGSLDEASGAPLVDREFAAFGKWLKPEYAIKIEEAFNQLKETGQKFDLIIETQNDRALEVQGRVSGDIPFARFYEMGQERKKHADISKKHENLVSQFALVEKLFEQLPFPVWLRDKDKKLFWTNEAYAKAVECENAEQATQQNKQLFDSSERAIIDVAKAQDQFFAGELPAIIAGDRNQVQTVEIATDEGEAGIAVDRSDIDYVRTTLKETITSHSQTIDNLNTAIAIFDSKQNLAFSNASFQSLWGLKTTLLEDSPSNGDILEAMRETSILPETPDWKKWKAKQLEAYRCTEPVEEQWHLTDGRT
ncbi:MAG: PAS-domain containing protein, partial [Nitratireductor sp.]